MTFYKRDGPTSVEMFFVISTIFAMFSCCFGALPFTIEPDEVATVAGKAFIYKLPAEMASHAGFTFKFYARESETLPSWLEYQEDRQLLHGVPSYHDKGSHLIRLDVINDETNKTADTFNFLFIEVAEYEEDLNHFKVLQTNTLAQPSKNLSQSSLDCPSHSPVIVATLVFDLNFRKFAGAKRVELLNSVSEWANIDVSQLRLIGGKGEKTAFSLREVVVLTAGPGSVQDPQERGVSVSWKIGCGDRVIESIAAVNQLKFSSQNDGFKKLNFPVTVWHVSSGRVQHRRVVRVRRQAFAQTPVPTTAFASPTVSIVIGTPTIAISPTVFTVTPAATRIVPSPTQTTSPFTTPAPPIIPPLVNTPPYIFNPIGVLTAEIDVPFTFYIPPETFHDKEDGPTPNLRLSVHSPDGNELPPDFWVQLDSNAQILRGTPRGLGEFRIALVVADSKGLLSDLDIVTIKVVRENKPPYLYNHIDLIKLYAGQPLVFKVPYDTFHDKEDGPTTNLRLSMRTIDDEALHPHSWVAFDAASQTIYALPDERVVGKHEFLMIARDSGGKKAVDAFEFHINPIPIEANHYFGVALDAEYRKFEESVTTRVKVCLRIGDYFGNYFNTSYKDIRVKNYEKGSVILEWCFANIATNRTGVLAYKEQYVVSGTKDEPVTEFKNDMESSCPISPGCTATKAYVWIADPPSTTPDPNVGARIDDDDDGTWWEYTIIPAFVIAALIFIIGLIIILCIRCRRQNNLDKNEKVVFVQRKKPAVFREEYPVREVYGDQPLITPNEKAPLPPPAYPRSSTPTEDPNEPLLLSDSSPSYQAPFDSAHEPAGSARPPVASYRLPPPYVAP